MNVKKRGNKVEKILLEKLTGYGFWAKLLLDDSDGQPFDIIAVKNGKIFAIDSKASVSKRFNYSRIEKNQYNSFSRVNKEGVYTGFAIYYNDVFYFLDFTTLKKEKSCKIEELPRMEEYLKQCL